MKRKILFTLLALTCIMLLCLCASAIAPEKPQLDVAFGDVTIIDGFVAPSELFVNTTERVLLNDGNGNYVTYPTYYITKDSTTFDVDFSKINNATGINYTKSSVAMLEIPNGIKALSNSYFSGTSFANCVSVQIPGSVTSYGSSLFSVNKGAKIVEFLDGDEPVTIGDGMFSGNWSGGPVIEYVRFPNNLVSIGNNTFGKATNSKTIILGANLKTIGTGFFQESTPQSTDTFIYVSDNFFADKDAMFNNLFGEYTQFHNKHMKLTLFYAGSYEDAVAFVEAGKAIQSGYVFSNTKLVSASEYDYDTHKPTSQNSMTLIYDVNPCDVFYNGEHKNSVEKLFDGEGREFLDDFVVVNKCKNCGNIVEEIARLDALIVNLGYSCNGNSLVYGFEIRRNLVDAYEAHFGEINMGAFASGVRENGIVIGSDGKGIDENVISYNYELSIFDLYSVKVVGITDENKDKEICIGAFLIVNGNVNYICGNNYGSGATSITYNQAFEMTK